MRTFSPRAGSCSYRAILMLDEHGAQYAEDLAKFLGVKPSALNVNMESAVRRGVLGHERRTLNGHSHNVWFITPKAYPLLEQMRGGQA